MPRRRLLLLLVGFGGLLFALVPQHEKKKREEKPVVEPELLIARLGDPRLRRDGADTPVFRPDSTAIAAASYDSADVVEWDVTTARERGRYADPKHPGQFISVIGYTPNGDRMLVRYDLARVVVYDTATAAILCRVAYDGVLAIAPDMRTAAARGRDKKFALRSLETGAEIAALGSDPIYDAAFSWDGHWLAAGFYCEKPPEGVPVVSPAYKGIAWVWPVAGGPKRTLTLPGDQHSNGVSVVWVRPNRVLAWTAHHMAVFDPATGERLATAVPSAPDRKFWKVWVRDGQLFVHEFTAKTAHEHDPDTLARLPGEAEGEDEVPFGPVISPDGLIRCELVGRYLRLVEVRTGRPLHPELDRLPTSPVSELHFSADGRRMITTRGDSLVWDLPSGTVRCRLGNHKTSTDAHLTADGRFAAGLDYNQHGFPFVVWNANTGAEVFREPPKARTPWSRRPVGFDKDGGFWAFGDHEFVQYEVPSGRVLQAVKPFEQPLVARMSPDGTRIVSGDRGGLAVRGIEPDSKWRTLETFSATAGGCVGQNPPWLHPVCFAPDGRRVLVGCWQQEETNWKVRAWNLSDPSSAPGAWMHFGSYPIFTPNGRFVVGGVNAPEPENAGLPLTPSTTLKITSTPIPRWLRVSDSETGAELFRLDPGAEAFAFTFTPDGKRLIVSHPDTTLTIWDWDAILRAKLRR